MKLLSELRSELLWGLRRAATELVKSASFQATGFQQEVFINVQFHLPAREVGGVPVNHSSVRWGVLDRHGRVPPVKRPVHPGA